MSDESPPTTLGAGRYTIEQLLGEGGAKRVYLARDERLGRPVALALLKTEGLGPEGIEALREEARVACGLPPHPHVVTIHDLCEDAGRLYLVSEYLSGGDLRARLDTSPDDRLELAETLRIAEHLCRALDHAHRQGVLHRDVNPHNVWLGEDGTAKLGDFGLAVSLARSRAIREGRLVTAVAYTAPEQLLGRPADPRCDLYALGAVLYELTTGRPPFLGDDSVAVVSQHVQTQPVAPSWRNADVPAALDALILKLLAKDPDARPPDAAAVLELLGLVTDSETVSRGSRNPLEALAGNVFVGREGMMRTLRGRVEDTLSGRGGVVLLSGEPGIGKTRTAEEASTYARLRGLEAQIGRCHDGEGTPPYWPWSQILRAAARELDPDELERALGSGAAALGLGTADGPGGADPPGIETPNSRFRLFESVTSLIRTLSQRRPLVLTIDDLHWSDGASLLLLRFLARELYPARVLVLGTFREEELAERPALREHFADLTRRCDVIPLRGLSQAEVSRLIQLTTGSEVSDSLAKAVHERTDGNPFFVTEFVRLLASEGLPESTAPLAWDALALPSGVTHGLERRLDALTTTCREVLCVAAVIGREFDAELLAAASEREACSAALDEGLARGILVETPAEPPRFRFSHALLRQALYTSLLQSRRAALHGQVADVLEARHRADATPVLAQLAHHFGKAGDARAAERGLHYAERAADSYAARGAWEDAVGLYRQALSLMSREAAADADADHRIALLMRLGDALQAVGESDASRTSYLEAVALARSRDDPAPFALGALASAGELASAEIGFFSPERVALLEEALERVGKRDTGLRARLLARLALDLAWTSQRERACELAEEAVGLCDNLDDEAQANIRFAQYWVAWTPDDLEGRLFSATQMVRAAESAGALLTAHQGRGLRSAALLEAGDRVQAELELDRAAETTSELRYAGLPWWTLTSRAQFAALDGSFDAAERLAIRAFQAGERLRAPNARPIFAAQIITIRMEQERLTELDDLLDPLRQVRTSPARAGIALLHVEAGRLADARAAFEPLVDDVEAMPRDSFWIGTMSLLARVAAALRDRERAAVLYERLQPYAARSALVGVRTACHGSVSLYLGMLARTLERSEPAVRHLEDALDWNTRLGARALVARTRIELAQTLVESGGEHARARELLEQARARYRELNVPQAEARAARLLEALAAPRDQASAGTPVPEPTQAADNALRWEDARWTARYAGRSVVLGDTKGLAYLACLLAEPEREFHVYDLITEVEGTAAADVGSPDADAPTDREASGSGPVLDAQARISYRQRLEELRGLVEDAERANDLARLQSAREESAWIERELARAFGLGGRARSPGDPVERARKTLYARIRRALQKIERAHPELGRHLARSVRTGTYCSYRPEQPTLWDTSPADHEAPLR